MALTLAESVLLAVRGAGFAAENVRIGDATDRTTWYVFPQALQAAAQATINAFDPASGTAIDAALTEVATREAARKDILATCALVAKYTDPAGWAALNTAQKIARVRVLANDYRDFRIFVERNL
jgi:hypothetical protein